MTALHVAEVVARMEPAEQEPDSGMDALVAEVGVYLTWLNSDRPLDGRFRDIKNRIVTVACDVAAAYKQQACPGINATHLQTARERVNGTTALRCDQCDPRACQCAACQDGLHTSGCAVHNVPAFAQGDCTCGRVIQQKTQATTAEPATFRV